MPKTYCGLCAASETTEADLKAHYELHHPGQLTPERPLPSAYMRRKQRIAAGFPVWSLPGNPVAARGAVPATPALDAIRSAETAIRQALRQLEDERDCLQRKIKELDDTINKYRKFDGGGQ